MTIRYMLRFRAEILSPRAMFLAVLLLPLSGCFFPCETEMVYELRSPDGDYVAYAYHRDCGATTSKSTGIAIYSAGKKLDPESDKGKIYAAKYVESISLDWTNDSNLVVEVAGKPEVFLETVKFGSIAIEYRTSKASE